MSHHHFAKKRFTIAVCLILIPLNSAVLTGCADPPVATSAKAAQVSQQTAQNLQHDIPAQPPEANSSMLDSASALLQRAASETSATAQGAQNWVQETIGDAAATSSNAANDTMQWANQTFETLKQGGLTSAEDTSQWLKQDWQNMQSWEYKTITLEPTQGVTLEDQLNRLGAQGWECFHINGSNFIFKKPRHSYLRHLPFNEFIKLVPMLQHAK